MAAGVQKAWSLTALDNGSADANINFVEGSGFKMPAINNSSRALMAAVKGFANQISAAKTTGGSANAQTLTSDSVAAISTAYAAGMIFCVKAGYTNSTTTPTFNVDGVGAKTIKKGGAQAALAASDIVAGGIYWIAYEASGDCFLLLNPDSGAISSQPLDATLTALAALSWSSGVSNVQFTADNVVSLANDALNAKLAGTAAFTALQTINLNAAALPSPSAGTVLHTGGADAATPRWFLDGFGGTPTWEARRAAGTAASPTAVQSGENLLNLQAMGYGTSAYGAACASIRLTARENFTNSAKGTRGSLHTVPLQSTTVTERYRFGDETSALELGYRDGGPGAVKTGDYTFALTDRGTPIDHNSGSAHAFTIPPASSVVMPENAILYGNNLGAGVLTLTKGSGVTFRNQNGTDANVTVNQYQSYMARRSPIAADTWIVRVF